MTAEYVHGKTGLDGPQLPEPDMPLQPLHGVDFIVETLLAEPAGDVTLCALGPLTNIGLALQQALFTQAQGGLAQVVVSREGVLYQLGQGRIVDQIQ